MTVRALSLPTCREAGPIDFAPASGDFRDLFRCSKNNHENFPNNANPQDRRQKQQRPDDQRRKVRVPITEVPKPSLPLFAMGDGGAIGRAKAQDRKGQDGRTMLGTRSHRLNAHRETNQRDDEGKSS